MKPRRKKLILLAALIALGAWVYIYRIELAVVLIALSKPT
jgi:hypothetical protein